MSTADYGAILEADDIISAAKDIVADMDGFITQATLIHQTKMLVQKSLQTTHPALGELETLQLFERSRFQSSLRKIYQSLLHIRSIARANQTRLTWTCKMYTDGH